MRAHTRAVACNCSTVHCPYDGSMSNCPYDGSMSTGSAADPSSETCRAGLGRGGGGGGVCETRKQGLEGMCMCMCMRMWHVHVHVHVHIESDRAGYEARASPHGCSQLCSAQPAEHVCGRQLRLLQAVCLGCSIALLVGVGSG